MNGNEDDQEDEAWQELAKTILPLKNKKPVVTRTVKLKKPVLPDREIAVPAIHRLSARPLASPLPHKRLKQLRQKKIPVQAVIDLHGMTITRAHEMIRRFLSNAFRNELRCVEVITGKGDPLRGTGLLKREFPLWLAGPDLRSIILHYEENAASRGGSFLVMLRRNKGAD